ncbi:Trihelix transcription factor asr3 [Thalictrum thalictroides]|uniref:Trihelix transcription factor asr3 n=1 Tax=Thalictrum thalictroides TaxID=46969 RepID=A0A7J6WVZ0_THATH|nr:Trihelix transcription factor asr3 [Thalictrum thalictroides]
MASLEEEKPVIVSYTNGKQTSVVDGGDDGSKTPRLPRWTRHEILVLIEGKRVAESRVRRGRTGNGSGSNQVEPKWVSISSYCKRHGVNREPVQCRKRWSNLAGDFRKIKEWESQIKEEGDSFWIMRNDLRREKKLPGFFDREIFDVLDKGGLTVIITGTELVAVTVEEEEDAVFDSGRTVAADDGLFSDFEQTKQEEDEMGETPMTMEDPKTKVAAPLPISERRYQPLYKALFDEGRLNLKPPGLNSEKGSPCREGQKKRRVSSDDGGDTSLQEQLVKVLESNNKMLAAQLEAQNTNCHLDRDQRKDQGDSLIAVLNKLADALGKIAEKI